MVFVSPAVADDDILADTMDRTVASGWGSGYTVSASASASVRAGAASLAPPAAGRTATVRSTAASTANVDAVTTFSIPVLPTSGSGVYVSSHIRDDGTRSYAARVRVQPNGLAELALVRFTGLTAQVLVQQSVSLGAAVKTGARLEVQATGDAVVELRARAWSATGQRPDWQVAYADDSATRIAKGTLAWSVYAASGGTAVPVSVDEIRASAVTATSTKSAAELACSTGAVVCDTFARTVSAGWGSAQAGGTWKASSGAKLSVANGSGSIASPAAGRTSVVQLSTAAPADLDTTVEVAVRALPVSGSGIYLTLASRLGADGGYGARLRIAPDGGAWLQIVRLNPVTTAQVVSSVRLDSALKVGSRVRVALQVTGSKTVALAAKAWPAGQTEPVAWTLKATDASATRVSGAGAVALTLYSSSGGSAPAVGITGIDAVRVSGVTTPSQPSTDPVTTPPVEAEPEPAPGADTVRGTPGAAAPGTVKYTAPAAAVHVAVTGANSNSGTAAKPVRTITAALSIVPNGGTIVVHKGTYHEEVLVPPQKKVTIQPASGEEVWLDGAEAVTGWRASGGDWIKDGWTVALDSSPTYTKGASDGTAPGWQFVNPDYPMAAHPDQVWVGGTQLKEVGSRAAVVAGTFYVDDAKDQLVIGSDPSGKKVEASTLTQALSIRSAGSEVRGIGVRRYATSVPQMGTVIVAAADVKLTDVTVRDNSTTGVYTWGARTIVTRLSVIDNGLLGFGASTADGLRVTGLLSTGNNASQFNRAPVSGAFKVTRSRDVDVTDSAFLDNLGQGPWFDESVYDIVFTGNDVIGNTGNGVVFELTEKIVIADNIVADNALSGVYLIDSGNASVWNNTLVGNQRNLNVTQDKRRASNTATAGHDPRQPLPDPTMPWITRNTVIVNNVIGDSGGNCLVCVEDYSKEFTGAQMVSRTDGNLYSRPTASQPAWFGVWARAGASANPATTTTLTAFTAATGQESHSRLVEGRSVVDANYRLVSGLGFTAASVAQTVPTSIAAVSHLGSGLRLLGAQPR